MTSTCNITFVIEAELGHVTHMQAMEKFAEDDRNIIPRFLQIPYQADDLPGRIPLLPFSMKLSLRARKEVSQLLRQENCDCLFYHTQALTLFSSAFMKKIPTVISLDATPINFESIASAYDAKTATGVIQKLKNRWFKNVFTRAVQFITISEWAKQSLVNDYGISAETISVIPFSVDIDAWNSEKQSKADGDRTRLLFVGGDFKRKGGRVLLDAFLSGLSDSCELEIVTRDDPGIDHDRVHVHRGLTPNSPELKRLFQSADVFIMPSEGDASPFVILEAMASSLPVITTRIGAVSEIVEDKKSGMLIPQGDSAAIIDSVRLLIDSPHAIRDMGMRGRRIVEEKYDARKNYHKLLETLKTVSRCMEP